MRRPRKYLLARRCRWLFRERYQIGAPFLRIIWLFFVYFLLFRCSYCFFEDHILHYSLLYIFFAITFPERKNNIKQMFWPYRFAKCSKLHYTKTLTFRKRGKMGPPCGNFLIVYGPPLKNMMSQRMCNNVCPGKPGPNRSLRNSDGRGRQLQLYSKAGLEGGGTLFAPWKNNWSWFRAGTAIVLPGSAANAGQRKADFCKPPNSSSTMERLLVWCAASLDVFGAATAVFLAR